MKLGLKALLLAGIIALTAAFNETAPEDVTDVRTIKTYEAPAPAGSPAQAEAPSHEGYTLNKVVVLSRHNIRSPLSDKGSMISEVTPHDWFEWTSNTGELSLRGAMLETTMGQYFRLWLEKEGLFPENYIPADGEVRFYANGFQRTQATARYFSAGLLPVAVVPVECLNGYNQADDTFLPKLNFTSEDYAADVFDEIAEMGKAKGRGSEGFDGYLESLEDAFRLIMEVTDMEESEAYLSGEYGNLLKDEVTMALETGSEPSMKGPVRMATSLADALILQYYEEPDDLKAAFGHKLTDEDWTTIGSVLATYEEILFSPSLLSVNLAHPMLMELRSELGSDERRFSFLCGHDSTVTSVLAALGTEKYTLPEAAEPTTPIGIKVVFEQWIDDNGNAFYEAKLVYQSVDQLRAITPLSLEVPPMIVPISFSGVETNADGLIPEDELLGLFDAKIDEYYKLEETYISELQNAA